MDQKNCVASLINDSRACPPQWDSVYCWPSSPPNATITIRCNEIFATAMIGQTEDHQTASDNFFAYRRCAENGQWDWNNWTNYTECLTLLTLEGEEQQQSDHISQVLSYIVLICSLCSLVNLIVAIVIFISFRSLQCLRIRVHKNLCIALLLHCAILIVMSSPVVLDDDDTSRLSQINWVCKCLKCLGIYSSMAQINWMFVEGFLLHTRLHMSPFASDSWHQSPILYHTIGWVTPAICVGIWSLVYELTEETMLCWRGYGRSKTILIVTAPMMMAVIINFVFLINIIRILIMKLRQDSGDTATLKAIRATAFLIPLLGIEHLIFCINPSSFNRHLESVYVIINGLTQSIQGMAVSILFCFTNTEVRTALSTAWSRRRLSHSIGHNCALQKKRKQSTGQHGSEHPLITSLDGNCLNCQSDEHKITFD